MTKNQINGLDQWGNEPNGEYQYWLDSYNVFVVGTDKYEEEWN